MKMTLSHTFKRTWIFSKAKILLISMQYKILNLNKIRVRVNNFKPNKIRFGILFNANTLNILKRNYFIVLYNQ